MLGYPWDAHVYMHEWVAQGLLLVAATTLVLFFAGGVYSDKIAYANKYVVEQSFYQRSALIYP